MADMLQEIVVEKPVLPVQFMIDYLAVGSSLCQQDKYGLSMMRRARLMKIFKAWDKKQDGTVDLKELRAFTGKHGGNAVSRDELKDIFMDMDDSVTQVNSPKGHQKADFYICEYMRRAAAEQSIRLSKRGSSSLLA